MKLDKRLRYVVGVGGFFALLLIIILVVRFFSSATNALVTIEGPKTVRNGQESIFTFHYTNRSSVSLHDVELEVSLPPSSLVKNGERVPVVIHSVGSLERRGRGMFELPITFFGVEGETISFGARLRYQPENASAFFETEQKYEVLIEGSVVEVSFEDMSLDASGNVRTAMLLNTHTATISNVAVHIQYPENFRFVGAAPIARAGTNNEWFFLELPGATTTRVAIFGRLIGASSVLKPFEARVVRTIRGVEFVLANTSSIDQTVSSGLVIFQKINNDRSTVVRWGDVLSVSVAYKNASQEILRDAFIEINFDPFLVDGAKSDFKGGFFDPVSGVVRFDPNVHRSLSELSPNEEGSFMFLVAVPALAPRGAKTIKNFVFSADAKISARNLSGEEVGGGDSLESKILTKVLLSSKVLFANQYAQNSGPVPLRVGQKTTYVVVWDVSNFSSDVRQSQVETFLGPNVVFERMISPQNAKMRYNTDMRHIIWDIGTLEAGTGFVTPLRQAVFQISIIPTQNQIGQNALLLGQSRFSGTDSFASNSIEAIYPPIYSDVPDDPTVNKQGAVQP